MSIKDEHAWGADSADMGQWSEQRDSNALNVLDYKKVLEMDGSQIAARQALVVSGQCCACDSMWCDPMHVTVLCM